MPESEEQSMETNIDSLIWSCMLKYYKNKVGKARYNGPEKDSIIANLMPSNNLSCHHQCLLQTVQT